MFFKKEIRKPILALLLISAGGLLIHLRLHPFWENSIYFLPFIADLVNLVVIPFLFNQKKTVIIAYLLNGIGVMIGTIAMITFSISGLPSPLTFPNMLLRTTVPYTLILLSKLFLGKEILQHFYPSGLGRFFNTWWWVRHFFYFLIALSLGHFLWR